VIAYLMPFVDFSVGIPLRFLRLAVYFVRRYLLSFEGKRLSVTVIASSSVDDLSPATVLRSLKVHFAFPLMSTSTLFGTDSFLFTCFLRFCGDLCYAFLYFTPTGFSPFFVFLLMRQGFRAHRVFASIPAPFQPFAHLDHVILPLVCLRVLPRTAFPPSVSPFFIWHPLLFRHFFPLPLTELSDFSVRVAARPNSTIHRSVHLPLVLDCSVLFVFCCHFFYTQCQGFSLYLRR